MSKQKQDESEPMDSLRLPQAYMNARYYDPAIGQFISPDTLVPDAGNVLDYNRYGYARGNPMRFNDPSGHCADQPLMTHLGCEIRSCVEANFNGGVAHAVFWAGWTSSWLQKTATPLRSCRHYRAHTAQCW